MSTFTEEQKRLIDHVASICWDEKDWTGCECFEDWKLMIYSTLEQSKLW